MQNLNKQYLQEYFTSIFVQIETNLIFKMAAPLSKVRKSLMPLTFLISIHFYQIYIAVITLLRMGTDRAWQTM